MWPLNPEGDLLAIVMIESVEGLKNVDEIAAVPGVGALFLGAGSDLSRSMGVPPRSPELEAAFQQIWLRASAANVPCGITAGNGEDVARRVKRRLAHHPLDGAGDYRRTRAARRAALILGLTTQRAGARGAEVSARPTTLAPCRA